MRKEYVETKNSCTKAIISSREVHNIRIRTEEPYSRESQTISQNKSFLDSQDMTSVDIRMAELMFLDRNIRRIFSDLKLQNATEFHLWVAKNVPPRLVSALHAISKYRKPPTNYKTAQVQHILIEA
ncbi:hypothetical protein JTB14_034481 [Gonioctena quinquepunctata]|nr:hypothetical protein JTB14_034481 [Gonioctena quinquepunctata]